MTCVLSTGPGAWSLGPGAGRGAAGLGSGGQTDRQREQPPPGKQALEREGDHRARPSSQVLVVWPGRSSRKQPRRDGCPLPLAGLGPHGGHQGPHPAPPTKHSLGPRMGHLADAGKESWATCRAPHLSPAEKPWSGRRGAAWRRRTQATSASRCRGSWCPPATPAARVLVLGFGFLLSHAWEPPGSGVLPPTKPVFVLLCGTWGGEPSPGVAGASGAAAFS